MGSRRVLIGLLVVIAMGIVGGTLYDRQKERWRQFKRTADMVPAIREQTPYIKGPTVVFLDSSADAPEAISWIPKNTDGYGRFSELEALIGNTATSLEAIGSVVLLRGEKGSCHEYVGIGTAGTTGVCDLIVNGKLVDMTIPATISTFHFYFHAPETIHGPVYDHLVKLEGGKMTSFFTSLERR